MVVQLMKELHEVKEDNTMKRKWLLVIALIGLVVLGGCSRPANTDETVGSIVSEDVSEKATESAENTQESKEDMTIQEPAVVPNPTATASKAIALKLPTERFIDFSSIGACLNDAEETTESVELTVISEENNEVSEIQNWFVEKQLFLPMLGGDWSDMIPSGENMPAVNPEMTFYGTAFYDDNYIYDWTSSNLQIYDRSSGQLLHRISYQMDKWYLMGNCAYLRDGILYMGYIYNGYAMPGTCYLLAYDIENEKVLWRSEDQTYNTMNFIVKDDIIICGYGFTSEKDYIYQIDMNSGKVISKTELKKMPELLVEKDGQLYVHTYSYDYVFDMDR